MTLFAPKERNRNLATGSDPILFVAMLALIALGVTMIYSATAPALEAAGLDPFSAMRRQAIWAMGSILAFLLLSFLDYKELQHFSWFLYGGVIVLLLATFFFPEVKGAHRWILIRGASLQPSEFAKHAMAAVIAAMLVRDRDDLSQTLPWRRLGACLAVMALPVLIIVRQPDMGTALVYLFMLAVMLYAGGASTKQIGLLALAGAGVGWLAIRTGLLDGYQMGRITSFLNPELDPLGDAYNQIQSVTAIGSGQFAGKGLFQGYLTQLSFVPEQESDFIFTAIGEQLGFIGAAVVIGIYGVILWRLLVIAATAEDTFGTLLLTGIAAVLVFHVFINIGMTVRLVPVTGIPLPFLSAGGSSLLGTSIALGIANSVWARRPATRAHQQRRHGPSMEVSPR